MNAKKTSRTKSYDPEQAKVDRADKLARAKSTLEDGVRQIQTSDDWARTLSLFAKRSRLSPGRLSFGNQLLILSQCGQTEAVATFKRWQDNGRNVKRGGKAAYILAPCPWKREDAKTGEEVRGLTFRPMAIFPLESTEGEPLPEIAPTPDLTADEPFTGALDALTELAKSTGVARDVVVRARRKSDPHPTARGWFSLVTREIVVIREGSNGRMFSTLVHECAHAILHGDLGHDARDTAELEAESVAYVVCKALDLDTADSSFSYIAGWVRNAAATEIVRTGDRIMKAANRILDTLEGVASEEEAVNQAA